MRSNHDPNPPLIVHDPERLLRKKKSQSKKLKKDTPPLVRSTSLPTRLVSPKDLSFDLKFKSSLFKSKS